MNNNIVKPHLIITPSVSIWIEKDYFVFDRKFYDGILLYLKNWGGKITCVMNITSLAQPDFGVVRKKEIDLPFACVVLGENEVIERKHLETANIILASGDSFSQLHVSNLCKSISIPCVYIIEYIPETRYQIAEISTTNYIVKLRRFIYIWNGERKRRTAFSLAQGIQANGMPAYKKYRNLTDTIIYYDNRINKDNIIGNDELEIRLSQLLKNDPIRIAFSGRLIRMKGADHLIKVAEILKHRNIKFHLTIYGAGDLDVEMKKNILKRKLSDVVTMAGVVDFYNELIPELKLKIDLFICLHRQSDPSCTYIETLSCGIPIVGYLNRAFSGMLDEKNIGWGSKLNDYNKIADTILYLDKNRDEIAEKSRLAMKYSRNHDSMTTFSNRVSHLKRIEKRSS